MAALGTGLTALEYEFGLDYEPEGNVVQDPDINEWRSYDELTDQSQRAVDRAIDNETTLYESRAALPGFNSDGKLGVTKGGADYVFYRRMVFAWWTLEGALSVVIGLAGLTCIGLAIRWE